MDSLRILKNSNDLKNFSQSKNINWVNKFYPKHIPAYGNTSFQKYNNKYKSNFKDQILQTYSHESRLLLANSLDIKNELEIQSEVQSEENNKSTLIVDLKYHNGTPVIKEIKRVSKPGRRIFSSAESLPKINNGLGIAIVSTPKGVMTDIDARKQKIGGEIICKVF